MALIASVKLRIYAKCWRHIFQRYKYIVLLPEVPEDTSETNSLLRKSKSPLFAELTTEHCINAIGKLAIEHDSKIHEFQEKLQDLEIPKNVQNVILPLDQFSASLDYAWGVLKLLNTVKHDAYTAEAYKKLHTRVLRAKRERYFYPSIYHAFKELKADEKTYTEPVQRIINKFLLESQLSGVDLPDRKKKHFKTAFFEIEKNIGEYRKKLAKVTNDFSHTLTYNDNIDELPSNLLRSIALDPMNYSKGPWKITLAPHVYQCFLEHCSDRVLRRNIWRANVTRASAESGRALNNSINIEEIRHHRQELAGLLGFKTFAAMSMKTKMAGSVENAMTMIHTLHAKSKYATLNELTALQDFAVKHGFQHDLQLWDIPFWQRLHKQDLFKLDEAAVCQYFPFPTVLKGLFKFCEQMFDIKIMEKTSEVETWDESVTYYKIYDQSGKYLSAFYLDPYTRPKSKLLGSYMEIGRNRSNVANDEPLSYLILNFDPPQFGKPSLLSFTDVNVLLQKFGHILQHSLTTVPYSDVAGLKNLEWDVVDVVPHVFTHWLKHYNTVAKLSGHVDTGASIPIEIHQRLQKAQKHMASLRLTEQLYLSALDLDLYTSKNFWLDVMRRNWNQYIPFPIEKFQSHLCSFPKIFCEEYPAAYFSFVWAEMIAADVFSAFKEVGLDNKEAVKEVAIRFRDTYLALGGGSQAGEVFRKFRGRDPSTEALLSINGISKHTEIQS